LHAVVKERVAATAARRGKRCMVVAELVRKIEMLAVTSNYC